MCYPILGFTCVVKKKHDTSGDQGVHEGEVGVREEKGEVEVFQAERVPESQSEEGDPGFGVEVAAKREDKSVEAEDPGQREAVERGGHQGVHEGEVGVTEEKGEVEVGDSDEMFWTARDLGVYECEVEVTRTATEAAEDEGREEGVSEEVAGTADGEGDVGHEVVGEVEVARTATEAAEDAVYALLITTQHDLVLRQERLNQALEAIRDRDLQIEGLTARAEAGEEALSRAIPCRDDLQRALVTQVQKRVRAEEKLRTLTDSCSMDHVKEAGTATEAANAEEEKDKIVTKKGRKKRPCPICGKSESQLTQHLKRTHRMGKEAADEVVGRLSVRGGIKRGRSGRLYNKCPECDASVLNLRRHMKSHGKLPGRGMAGKSDVVEEAPDVRSGGKEEEEIEEEEIEEEEDRKEMEASGWGASVAKKRMVEKIKDVAEEIEEEEEEEEESAVDEELMDDAFGQQLERDRMMEDRKEMEASGWGASVPKKRRVEKSKKKIKDVAEAVRRMYEGEIREGAETGKKCRHRLVNRHPDRDTVLGHYTAQQIRDKIWTESRRAAREKRL